MKRFGEAMKSDEQRKAVGAAIFAVSLVISVGLGVFGPRLLGLSAKPGWMLWTEITFGLLAVLTVPIAWRWLYRRPAA